MNFLFVIDNLSTGGAQRQMVNLAVGLKKRGHTVTMFVYTPGEMLASPLEQAGIEVVRAIKSSRFSIRTILTLCDTMQRTHCEVVLSFLTTPNTYTILASRLLFKRPRVIVSERFCDPPEGISRLERICRQSYRLADHVVVNSNHQRLNFAHKYPWMCKKLSTIYNGYDLNQFHPMGVRQNNHELTMLTIASVSPYKNGLVVIEAMRQLKEKDNLQPHMDWIGQRVMEGVRLEYMNRMQAAIGQYGLSGQWEWLDQRGDILEQMNSHDVLIHPSYGEGLPNVVCEALACGLPVILSNTLDHPDLVQDGESGYLFDHRDATALAEKIKHFHGLSKEERKKLGENGRKFAENNLSLEIYITAYENLFHQIASL